MRNLFSRFLLNDGLLFDDDPLNVLPAGGNNNPAPSPRKKLCCEFCECELAPTGEIIKMGGAARGFRDAGDSHERAIKAIEKERDELRAKVTELTDQLRGRDAARDSSGLHF